MVSGVGRPEARPGIERHARRRRPPVDGARTGRHQRTVTGSFRAKLSAGTRSATHPVPDRRAHDAGPSSHHGRPPGQWLLASSMISASTWNSGMPYLPTACRRSGFRNTTIAPPTVAAPSSHDEMPVRRPKNLISSTAAQPGAAATTPVAWRSLALPARSTAESAVSRQSGGASPGLRRDLSSEKTTHGAMSLASWPNGTSSGSLIARTCGSATSPSESCTKRISGRYSSSKCLRRSARGTGLKLANRGSRL